LRNPEAEKPQSLKSAFKSVTPQKSNSAFPINALLYASAEIAGQQ